ncbi:MAG: MFS transporter [Gemmatimonadota bacterium]|nr:MFS transporter [Gemmatimonadota bacterium]
MTDARRHGTDALIARLVDVRPEEVRAMLVACAYFFFLMSSYFILRPIRDSLAVAAGVSKLPFLFLGTLTAMLICNPIFSALVVRFPVKRFIVITYQFFALNLLAFYFATRAGGNETWLGLAFFWWTSVFNLFVPSLFWCFMADTFRSEQAKRLFGFIGVGGTLGSIAGAWITGRLASRIGAVNLLLVSVTLLEIAVLIVVFFPAKQVRVAIGDAEPEEIDRGKIGGGILAGITHVARSPYLLGISAFLILYTLGSTVLYFQQTEIIGHFYKSKEARIEILANMEAAAQTLTALTQIFLTGRIIRWIGLGATLAIMPALSMIGFAALSASALGVTPLLATFVVFSVLRRGTNFALTNPSMEALFTVVSREDKYKAKSFIETFVYRAGDQLGAWGYAGLAALGFGLAGIAGAAVPLSALFLGVGVWLGRRQSELASKAEPRPIARADDATLIPARP